MLADGETHFIVIETVFFLEYIFMKSRNFKLQRDFLNTLIFQLTPVIEKKNIQKISLKFFHITQHINSYGPGS